MRLVNFPSGLIIFSVFLSLTWLLPNHYPPWAAFHLDAWAGFMLLIASWHVFGYARNIIHIPTIALAAWVLILIIGLQLSFDLIFIPSTAFLGINYLGAFALAVILGSQSEQQRPKLAAHVLFLAVGIASILSVGMQLHQWLNLTTELLDIWSMGPSIGRPFANFGQPNQLATFLLWGLFAIFWGYLHEQIRSAIALFAASFILWGIALANSRTAMLGLVLMFIASYWWRNLWPTRKIPWIMAGMILYLIAALLLIAWINTEFGFNSGEVVDSMSQMSAGQRFKAWRIFIDAILLQPWFGYGFNQVKFAEMVASDMHPALNVMFAQSHNLFIDFLLWFGVPIGLLCILGLLAWIFKLAKTIKKPEQAILWLMVLVIGNHAMFELPLHYAYFLIPIGVVLGILDNNTKLSFSFNPEFSISKTSMIVLLVLISISYSIVIKEYLISEQSYRDIRFELANFRDQPRSTEPDVLVLTEFRDFIRMARMNPEELVSDEEIDRARRIVSTSPSPAGLYKYAVALSLRHENEKARLWLQRLCKVMDKPQCAAVKVQWLAKSQTEVDLQNVDWKMIEQN